MAKKIDEAEVKKECPSCGLGVALDATICEFCGWDFEEEDEWILQIEKLERELMLEKQKFEPGSVESKIESTLHSPTIEMKKAPTAKVSDEAKPAPKPPTPAPTRGPSVMREARPAEVKAPRPSAPTEAPREPERVTRPAQQPQATAAPKARRVRTVKAAPASAQEEQPSAEAAQRKTRLVRKVKQ